MSGFDRNVGPHRWNSASYSPPPPGYNHMNIPPVQQIRLYKSTETAAGWAAVSAD